MGQSARQTSLQVPSGEFAQADSNSNRRIVADGGVPLRGRRRRSFLDTASRRCDSLLRELGKVFGLPKAEIDALQDNRNHPETPDHITRLIYQYMNVLKSFPSHLSIHAGGILISQEPITCYTALSNPPKGFPLTQFSMQEAEDVGLYKFDILSQLEFIFIKTNIIL